MAKSKVIKPIQLGNKVRDIVTGLEGIAYSKVEYLNGCIQYGVRPPAKEGKLLESEYIDHNQLVVIGEGVARKVNNTGGIMSGSPKGIGLSKNNL